MGELIYNPKPGLGNMTLDECWAKVLGQPSISPEEHARLEPNFPSPLCHPGTCLCHPRVPTWDLVVKMFGYSLFWFAVLVFLGILSDHVNAGPDMPSGKRKKLNELTRSEGFKTNVRWVDCLLSTSKFGSGLLRFILSLTLCVLFGIKAYKQGQPTWMAPMEVVILLCFAVEYLIGFVFFATSRLEFVLSTERIAMVLSISSGVMSAMGICETWLTLNFLQAVTVYTAFKDMLDVSVDNKIYAALLKAFSMFTMLVFVFACAIFTVEILGEVEAFDYYSNPAWEQVRDQLPMTLTEAVYFTMITVSTVGYGDFSPSTVVGRMMTMLFILVGIAFFTTVTHDSVDMVRYLRSGHGRYPKLSGIPHCVIVGDLSPETLVPFFQEFFSESRRNSAPKVFNKHCELVLLSPLPKDEQMISLLRQYTGQKVRPEVHFLRGSALEENDLQRAGVDSAVACFVISQRLVDDEDDEDANTIMKFSSINRFNPGVDCILALCKLNNQEHAIVAGAKRHNIVCFREMRLKLLARATECEGFSCLITNLITSRDDISLNKHPELKGETEEDKEYFLGMSQKINRVSIDHVMELFEDAQKFGADGVGDSSSGGTGVHQHSLPISFEEALLTVYAKSNGLLIGLIKKNEQHGITEVTLAPPKDTEVNPQLDSTIVACVILSNYGAEGYLGSSQDGRALLTKFQKDMNDSGGGKKGSGKMTRVLGSLVKLTVHTSTHDDTENGGGSPRTRMLHGHADPLQINPDAKGEMEDNQWEGFREDDEVDGSFSPSVGERKLLQHNRKRYAKDFEKHGESFMEHVNNRRIQRPLLTSSGSATLPAPTPKDMIHYILVVGTPPDGMVNFVEPLRLNPRWSDKSIVFYGPTPPSGASYRQLVQHGLAGGVFFVRGALRVEEVELCNLDKVHRIVIITPSDPSNRRVDREKVEPQLADSRQIFMARYFAGKYPNARVITEIANDQSVKYFDHRSAPLHKPDAVGALLYSNGIYRSGRLAPVSTVYNLLVGVYYNSILQRTDKNVKDASWSTATVIRKLVNGKESAIFQKRVPKRFAGKLYQELLVHTLTKNMAILLGLFRKQNPSAPYVFTNPPPNIVLRDTDKMFLLTKKCNTAFLRRASVVDVNSAWQAAQAVNQFKTGRMSERLSGVAQHAHDVVATVPMAGRRGSNGSEHSSSSDDRMEEIAASMHASVEDPDRQDDSGDTDIVAEAEQLMAEGRPSAPLPPAILLSSQSLAGVVPGSLGS